MFRLKLKAIVEEKTNIIKRTNPLFQKAFMGTLTAEECTNYLSNLMFLFQYTCPHLKVAKRRAFELGNIELADFFSQKSKEEQGHDLWAKDDLKKIGHPMDKVDLSVINSATFDMFSHIRKIVDGDPVRLLGHMFFVEYFTVLVSPDFLKGLDRCGFKKEQLSAISNHAELDVEHIEDDLNAIDQFVKTPQQEREVLQALEDSAAHTHEFLAATVLPGYYSQQYMLNMLEPEQVLTE